MFAHEWCEFCWSVRKLFKAFDIPYRSVDLDSAEYQKDDLGGRIRKVLRHRTGSPTIPQIFVGNSPHRRMHRDVRRLQRRTPAGAAGRARNKDQAERRCERLFVPAEVASPKIGAYASSLLVRAVIALPFALAPCARAAKSLGRCRCIS